MFLRRLLSIGTAWLMLLGTSARAGETFTFHHDPILGTSLELRIEAATEAAANAAEARVLAEIERLSAIFSTYRAESEFSRWQRADKIPMSLSSELLEMLTAADAWRTRSSGAFEPGVEHLHRLWKNAETTQQLPSNSDIQAAVNAIQQPHWQIDPQTKTVTRLSEIPLSLNAIAKGAIVERASRVGRETPGVEGLILNVGGDMRITGNTLQVVQITDPRNDAVNAPTIERIYVNNRAVATSGDYRRGYKIGEQWFSHIIDPRTGQPAAHVISATVVAKSSADADALATICNVLPVEESLKLINAQDDVDVLLITSDGQRHTSTHWSELRALALFRFTAAQKQARPVQVALAEDKPATDKPAAEAKPAAPVELLELTVKFELNRPSGAQYRRPYVAVWIEDEDEFPVRTAVLWMQTKQPGPRWHRDLLRWFRNDGIRKLADNTNLIGTISGASRGPGEYKAIFDGRDDAGNPLKPGKYTLFLEAAREHGTYQLIRHELTLGKEPIAEAALKSNVEFKSATVEYKAPAPKPATKDAP